MAWLALTPLIISVALVSPAVGSWRRAFVLGVVTGGVYFLGTVYWVATVMAAYGGLSVVVAGLVTLLFVSYLAAYCGLFGVGLHLAIRRFGVAGVWWTPALWIATEWLRSTIGGGFPWVLLGASQSTVLPIAQSASVVGVFGLSGLVAATSTAAAAVALSRGRGHRAGALVVVVIVAAAAAGGTWRIARADLVAAGAPLRVGLVQGNIAQDQKWDPAYQGPILQQYLALSGQAISQGADLVVWPEASTPFYLNAQAALAAPIRQLAVQTGTPFVIGTDEFERGSDGAPDRIYNTAVLIGTDGRSESQYRKMQLVPFGEYVPLQSLLFFVGPLVESVSHFSPGTEPTVLDTDGRRLSVAICYESVYPWIARAFVDAGSQLLVTITNDAWFGRSSAAYQHFDQGALRAIEQGRFVVRAANTGISGAVDPYGRALARTPLFEPLALTVDVRLLDGRTFYGRTGDLSVWLSLGLCAWVVVSGGRRRGTVAGRRP